MVGIVSERAAPDRCPDETTIEPLLRREILAAAVEELRLSSFERFSVESVAGRAALAPGVVRELWSCPEQLVVDAVVELCDLVLLVPNTGSLRSDLAGLLTSLADCFNTDIGRSLLRTGVIGPDEWAPTGVSNYLWTTSVEAVRVIFERAERRNETRPGIDHNIALQLATGPLFSRGLYSNDPMETTQFCTLIADLVWRAVRRDDAPAAVVDGDASKPLRAGRVFAAR